MINLGLSRITQLLTQTPIPWRAIHIAGTNGKGSVACIASALLHASKIPVGRFTSPHLINRWDCISINEKTVSKSLFIQTEDVVKERNARRKIDATEFELLTATAFEIFTREKIRIGVVECGLGGRLDATNVLKPEEVVCSVITKIGLDHQSILGDTIEKIAFEKAGIMKRSVPVVIDQSNSKEVLEVMRKHSDEVGALMGSNFTTQDFKSRPLHEQQNINTALSTLSIVQVEYPNVREIINKALSNWQGRLQELSIEKLTGRTEPVLLDGAHNPQAAEALATYVDSLRKKGITWVIARTADRPTEDFLRKLIHEADQVVITSFQPVDGMPWVKCMELPVLEKSIKEIFPTVDVISEQDPLKALKYASRNTDDNPIVICGSLYLIGDVLRLLQKKIPTGEARSTGEV